MVAHRRQDKREEGGELRRILVRILVQLDHLLNRVNPSQCLKSRVFAPLSRALVGRGGARDVLGWTAVAQCPTLSAKYFSVSLKISICGLTNMAKSTTLPAFCRTVQWWPEVKIGRLDRAERTGTPRIRREGAFRAGWPARSSATPRARARADSRLEMVDAVTQHPLDPSCRNSVVVVVHSAPPQPR